METTTIQIYREDMEKLKNICKKGENFRDKFHEILNQEKDKNEI